ncbi:hypothetical protein FRC01_001563 [Tulasnella sp. 417]|nr:hypothetical protein FRC01_001563 [Tulasnella sp. 417]
MASSNQPQPPPSSRQNLESSLLPVPPPKTLILCFDGTSNSFSDENTNVVRLFNALEKHKMARQMCYYQPGIGRSLRASHQALISVSRRYFEKIMGGYKFLMENYSDGDKICLFGFSRGAYTARCLAGMLHKVGLVPKSNEEQVQFAYKKYKDSTPSGKANAKGFKATFSRDIEIEFLGVWDTVSSVGLLSRHLPFTASNTIVRTFRHALALDEHRAKFSPNPWHRAAPSAAAARFDPDRGTPLVRTKLSGPAANIVEKITDKMGDVKKGAKKVGQVVEGLVGDVVEGKTSKRRGANIWRKRSVKSVDSEAIDYAARAVSEGSGSEYDDDYYHGNYHGSKETDVKEVWFAGCHADVGGGSVNNNKTNTLANPSLVWMVNEILGSDVPVLFKKKAFEDMPAFDALMIKLPRERVSDPTPATATPQTVVENEAGPSAANGLQLDPTTPGIATDTPQRTPPPIRRDAFITHTILEAPKVMRPSSTIEGELTSASAPSSPEHDTRTHASKLPQVSIPLTKPPKVLVQSPASMTPPHPESPQPPGAAPLPTAGTTISMAEWSPTSDRLTVVQVFEDNPKRDANAPMYDQLQRKKIWWVLEWIPLWQYHQDKEGSWHKGFYWNRGRPREIQDPNPLFHSSVKLRKNYEPRARLQPGAKVTYVD